MIRARDRVSLGDGIVGFVAPALARCDIGVRFSVRQSVRPSFRPQFTSTLAFKSIQMTYSLKPLDQ